MFANTDDTKIPPQKPVLCIFVGLYELGYSQQSPYQHLTKEGKLKTCPEGQAISTASQRIWSKTISFKQGWTEK